MHLLLSASLLLGGLHDPFAPNNYEVVTMVNVIHLPAGTPYELVNFERERRALLRAATLLEVIDETHSAQWLYGPGSFQDELDLIRELFAELEGCPRLGEGEWLPNYAFAHHVCVFNARWIENLQETARWNPDWAQRIEAILDRGRPIHTVYHHILWYRSDWSTVSDRRKALRDVRDMIGPEKWERREWPETALWEAFAERSRR